ncbi:hypothetical protein Dimus_030341 [Dionaea muscipula]
MRVTSGQRVVLPRRQLMVAARWQVVAACPLLGGNRRWQGGLVVMGSRLGSVVRGFEDEEEQEVQSTTVKKVVKEKNKDKGKKVAEGTEKPMLLPQLPKPPP